MNDDELRSKLEELQTALLCDVMDVLGFRDSAFGMNIRPIEPGNRPFLD